MEIGAQRQTGLTGDSERGPKAEQVSDASAPVSRVATITKMITMLGFLVLWRLATALRIQVNGLGHWACNKSPAP